ncbi:hypothetical protein C7534_102367 [Pseudomonas sp. OV226]|nr:hypothetical protein C7534_102367 [Pseudomonas sp. OV226]
MNATTQTSSSIADTLKARQARLIGLLKIVDTGIGKSTAIQTLTINAIKAEMRLIDNKLKSRK